MRKVVLYELLSLDGVAEAPDQFFTDWDDEMQANMVRVIGSQDAVILGRRTSDDWSQYWPPRMDHAFGAFINPVAKYIATSRPLDSAWANAQVIEGDLVDFVQSLKQREGGDIGVHGSLTVARTLLTVGLVDEIRVVIAPTVVGAGQRLFDDVPPLQLESVRSVVSPAGYQLLDYRIVS